MRWVFGLVFALALVLSASAEVPQQLHYNGYLTNAVGAPVDCPDPIQCESPIDVIFRIYASSEGGSPLWEESYPAMPVFAGSFHATLGTINPVNAELMNGPTWLSVKVNDNAEMAPRQKITASAYAIRAGTSEQAEEAVNATQLGGVDAAEYATQTILAPVATAGLSPDLADGDDDVLASLGCGEGMVAKATSIGTWVCGVDDGGGVDTTLSEEEVDAMVSDNGYALEANLEAAQAALAELQAQVNDIDASTGVDISALQGTINTVEANLVALDTSLDPIAKADLACATGQVPQHNGSAWVCGHAGGSLPTVAPIACDTTTLGNIYFDTEDNTLRVCDGTSFRKVKLCSEICPDPNTVPCAQAVEDDCGSVCDGTGTALNSNQCNEAVVQCGQPVLDGCGNDCGSTGLMLNSGECPDPAVTPCGQNTTDGCGNLCGQQGTHCADPLTPFCDVTVCTGIQIVAHLNGRRWADGSYADSCHGYKTPVAGYSYAGETGDGTYTVQSGGEIFDVFCDMTSDGGGWTLVLMVQSDDFSTFRYDSSYWTNTTLLNEGTTDPNADTNMKNRAYNTMSFSEMRLAMDTIHNVLQETVSSSSAQALFTGGYVSTSHSRESYLNWHPQSPDAWSNQGNCNLRGFQPAASGTNCRYGLLMNNESDCSSNDAAIGFGCHSQDFYVNRTSACGGHRWQPDVAYNYQGWIFVR